MRIDAYNKVNQIYQTNRVATTSKEKKTSFRDQLEISQTGKDYQVAKQAVATSSDIRMNKIEEIKQRMQAGTYKISSADVADKVVEDFYKTSL